MVTNVKGHQVKVIKYLEAGTVREFFWLSPYLQPNHNPLQFHTAFLIEIRFRKSPAKITQLNWPHLQPHAPAVYYALNVTFTRVNFINVYITVYVLTLNSSNLVSGKKQTNKHEQETPKKPDKKKECIV